MHRKTLPFYVSTVTDGDTSSGGGETEQTRETPTKEDASSDSEQTVTLKAMQERVAQANRNAERNAREKLAKKYGDLDELQKAASRLQEIEDANKTEQQRAADELAALKAAAASSAAEAIRYRVAATNGVVGDDMDLLGVGDEEVLAVRAKRIGVLVAAERELNDLKKAQEDAGKRAPLSGRPDRPGWPGATPVQDGRPSARDAGLAAARARGHAAT